MTNRNDLLRSLLIPLVREWGHERVQDEVAEFGRSLVGEASEPEFARRDRKRKAPKLLAVEQLERAVLSEPQKVTLKELAERFDRKQFLPSVSDARDFLMMIGERPGAIKDRSDAFKRLLRALSKFSPDQLFELAARARHSGPSQLGALSDAISDVASTMPRYSRSD